MLEKPFMRWQAMKKSNSILYLTGWKKEIKKMIIRILSPIQTIKTNLPKFQHKTRSQHDCKYLNFSFFINININYILLYSILLTSIYFTYNLVYII